MRERERETAASARAAHKWRLLVAFPPNFKGKGLHIFLRAQKEAVAFVLSSFALLEIRTQKSSVILSIHISRTFKVIGRVTSSVMGAKQSSQDDGRENLEALKEEIERLRKALSEEEERKKKTKREEEDKKTTSKTTLSATTLQVDDRELEKRLLLQTQSDGEVDSASFASQNEVDPKRICLLYTSPSPRDATLSRMPSSA